jgi:hypothetical protein
MADALGSGERLLKRLSQVPVSHKRKRLAVTHCWVKEGNLDEQRRLAFCNLRLMTQALTTKTKKGAKWMKGKGATKILHYLYKEVPKEVDSSDDEEDVSFIPPLKW